jgi:hypothetical protein
VVECQVGRHKESSLGPGGEGSLWGLQGYRDFLEYQEVRPSVAQRGKDKSKLGLGALWGPSGQEQI